MDQERLKTVSPFHLGENGGNLHEVGASTDHARNLEFLHITPFGDYTVPNPDVWLPDGPLVAKEANRVPKRFASWADPHKGVVGTGPRNALMFISLLGFSRVTRRICDVARRMASEGSNGSFGGAAAHDAKRGASDLVPVISHRAEFLGVCSRSDATCSVRPHK